MSPASSRRLKRALIRVDYLRTNPYLVTLTYHRAWGPDPRAWHEHLHRFELELERDWAPFQPGGIWREEFQRRGAPHFHILLTFSRPPAYGQFKRWLSHTWNDIAEPGDAQHLAAGTNVERIRVDGQGGVLKLVRYLAKYLGKRGQDSLLDPETGELCPTGRTWGTFLQLPQSELATFSLDESQRVILARRLRRWGKRSRYCSRIGKRYNSCLVLILPSAFRQLLRGIADEQAASLALAIRGP
jgi:hypothetical protein